jgi:toxin YoeB
MSKLWQDDAWDDYLYWQTQDRKTLKKINALLKDIERNGYNCIGSPEPLKHGLSNFWSVEIDRQNRIVFRINDDGNIEIAQCGSHYRDK